MSRETTGIHVEPTRYDGHMPRYGRRIGGMTIKVSRRHQSRSWSQYGSSGTQGDASDDDLLRVAVASIGAAIILGFLAGRDGDSGAGLIAAGIGFVATFGLGIPLVAGREAERRRRADDERNDREIKTQTLQRALADRDAAMWRYETTHLELINARLAGNIGDVGAANRKLARLRRAADAARTQWELLEFGRQLSPPPPPDEITPLVPPPRLSRRARSEIDPLGATTLPAASRRGGASKHRGAD